LILLMLSERICKSRVVAGSPVEQERCIVRKPCHASRAAQLRCELFDRFEDRRVTGGSA
jgi:hypothetical protein